MTDSTNSLFSQLRVPVGVLILAVILVAGAGCSSDPGDDVPDGSIATVGRDETPSSPVAGTNGETEAPSTGVPTEPVEDPNGTEPEDGVTDGHSPEEPVVPQGPPDGGAAEPPKVDVILTPPKVLLSAGHQELCLVSVGDAMPAISLPDAAGETQGLKQLYGEKLTVVLFWNSTHPYAQEQFERFHLEVVAPYGAHGVGAVAINVGDDPASVKAAIEGIEDGFPVLFDEGGKSLGLVATRKLPRTYLLDPAGRILWFDIEYSESTRRELKNAILWHLTRQS